MSPDTVFPLYEASAMEKDAWVTPRSPGLFIMHKDVTQIISF